MRVSTRSLLCPCVCLCPTRPCSPAAPPGRGRPPALPGQRRRERLRAAMSPKGRKLLVDTLTRSAKHFTKSEVECLIKLYDTLVAKASRQFAGAGFDRTVFRDTLYSYFGMTDDMVLDRVFIIFDKDNTGRITVEEWVEGLAPLLRGSLEEKMKYCFAIYDLNGDGYISKKEMFEMLKHSLLIQPGDEEPDEVVKDLVDIALKKMDYDRDGKLSFTDFEKAVRDESLLLEAFGPCLPDLKSTMSFEQKIFREIPKK
ncbi:calaxin [Zonotrichia leucophrys gambelii]|uniref:calaxin n=1 Tax=Zonotrichia leucophrys gambelii TaxID=257770 RepID=UPI00313FE168